VMYAEGYPSSRLFAKKHVPLLYFPGGSADVQPLSRFRVDALPELAFVVPNLCHDMHDCPTSVGDAWLRRFVTPLLDLPETAIFVVFDESGSPSNAVPAAVLGTAVAPHSVSTVRVTHYGLLRTLEDAFGVVPLGAAASARPIAGIWK
jgi:phosphatidylinositol-3-phosphatase